MTLAKVPLDAPIPTTETLYVWDEIEECWMAWLDWIFRQAHRNAEAQGGGRAAARKSAAQPLPLQF